MARQVKVKAKVSALSISQDIQDVDEDDHPNVGLEIELLNVKVEWDLGARWWGVRRIADSDGLLHHLVKIMGSEGGGRWKKKIEERRKKETNKIINE